MAQKKGTDKRELIDTATDKRYAKRNADGTFKEMDDVGRSQSSDRRNDADNIVESGYGDQGDQKRGGKS